jgi:hypothetical protein
MRVLLWLFYVLAILMTWFANRWIVGAWPLDRPLWYSSSGQARFYIIRLAVTYGTLAGLWYSYGLLVAAIAFVFYYVFNKVSFHIYFTREVQRTAQGYADLSIKEAKDRNEQPDELAIRLDAFEWAKRTVVRNMKGEQF